MCLLLLALNAVPGRPWLLLGNRDEFHARPTAPAHAWADHPGVIGGRDLEAGGSWLAVHADGRYAAVTNVRNGSPQRGARSRGELVGAFVAGLDSPIAYATDVARRRDQYGAFNLIVGDATAAWGASSLLAEAWQFQRGVHVLSNGAPDAQWPKVRQLRERFVARAGDGAMGSAASTGQPHRFDDDLLDLLGDTTQPEDAELPHTGVGIELERRLAPIFIRGTTYGTRASTLAYQRSGGGLVLCERRFGPDGSAAGKARIEI